MYRPEAAATEPVTDGAQRRSNTLLFERLDGALDVGFFDARSSCFQDFTPDVSSIGKVGCVASGPDDLSVDDLSKIYSECEPTSAGIAVESATGAYRFISTDTYQADTESGGSHSPFSRDVCRELTSRRGQQRAGSDVKGIREPLDVVEGNVPHPAFHVGDECAMQAGFVGQVFLGPTACGSQALQIFSKDLAGGRRLRHSDSRKKGRPFMVFP
ncbi:hypothetical protein [Aromatoleum toluolicum]|uniref:hypothetical protein n=1 Tax=Aromatoleum toluolicum TaxID=90060 RepID=UPI00402BB8B4